MYMYIYMRFVTQFTLSHSHSLSLSLSQAILVQSVNLHRAGQVLLYILRRGEVSLRVDHLPTVWEKGYSIPAAPSLFTDWWLTCRWCRIVLLKYSVCESYNCTAQWSKYIAAVRNLWSMWKIVFLLNAYFFFLIVSTSLLNLYTLCLFHLIILHYNHTIYFPQ